MGLGTAAPAEAGQVALSGSLNQLSIDSRNATGAWIFYNVDSKVRLYSATAGTDRFQVHNDGTVVASGLAGTGTPTAC
jgi:hypothetical protein